MRGESGLVAQTPHTSSHTRRPASWFSPKGERVGMGPTHSPTDYSVLQEGADDTEATCSFFAQDVAALLWPSQHVGSQHAGEPAFCELPAKSTEPPASATMNARVARIRFIASSDVGFDSAQPVSRGRKDQFRMGLRKAGDSEGRSLGSSAR